MYSTRFLTQSQIWGSHNLHMMYKSMKGQLEVNWTGKEERDAPATLS